MMTRMEDHATVAVDDLDPTSDWLVLKDLSFMVIQIPFTNDLPQKTSQTCFLTIVLVYNVPRIDNHHDLLLCIHRTYSKLPKFEKKRIYDCWLLLECTGTGLACPGCQRMFPDLRLKKIYYSFKVRICLQYAKISPEWAQHASSCSLETAIYIKSAQKLRLRAVLLPRTA